jgi:hypothetical protein
MRERPNPPVRKFPRRRWTNDSAVRAVDVLVHLTTARFDRALTYAVPNGPPLRVGDIVRVPLGSREVFAYVVSGERQAAEGAQKLRAIGARTAAPRAFDDAGLALAHWVAHTYLCSLREALATIVLADAVPRVVERLVPLGPRPAPERFPSVPDRLVRLLWDDAPDGISPAALLRHPEARRSGDRRTLLAAIGALVRGGVLERRRTFLRPPVNERTIRILEPGQA